MHLNVEIRSALEPGIPELSGKTVELNDHTYVSEGLIYMLHIWKTFSK